jgi:Putative Actinobacterial Holin-X, holin superfamily III
MATHIPSEKPEKTGIADLVMGILQDARSLMRQEVQLLKDEVKLEVSKAGRAASGLGIGIGLTAVGGFLLLLMLVHGLQELAELPLWVCYGIVGGVMAGIGGVLIGRARSLAGSIHAMPRRTLYAIQEDARWIKEQIVPKKKTA